MKIEKSFLILEKTIGEYHSFPTVIRHGDKLWMSCRSGKRNPRQCHGIDGHVRLFSSDIQTPDKWISHGPLFTPTPDGTINELDAVLSMPEPGLFFLATRDYVRGSRNNVFLSRGTSPIFHKRKLLASVSDRSVNCFGHIRKTICGDLLLPGYCPMPDEQTDTPVLLISKNMGTSWSFLCKVASSADIGTRMTEYSLGYLGGTNWACLIRNETPPYTLYQSHSRDDGKTWTPLEKTSLMGHAPMIMEMEGRKGHLVLYRDLSGIDPGIGIGYGKSNCKFWEQIGRLTSYKGSIYDGGYGDLVCLGNNRYLAIYYISDGDGCPWLEGCTFRL